MYGVVFVKSLLCAVCNGWKKVGSDVPCWGEKTSLEKSIVLEDIVLEGTQKR